MRSLRLIPRQPSTFIPSLLFPIFLTITFSGALTGLTMLRGFPASEILDWFIPMTTVQGAAFAGITTGMAIARDLENGFYDRLLSSPASRSALLAGPLLASAIRAFIPITLMLLITVISAAQIRGGPLGVLTFVLAGVGVAVAAGGWAIGLALRARSQAITPLMQAGVFITVFLSTAQMPLHLLTGWVHAVAHVNPMSEILSLAREGFLGEVTWAGSRPGLLALAGTVVLLVGFAGRGMQKVVS